MSHVPSPRFGCISFNLSAPSPTASPDALQCAGFQDHHDQHPCQARRVSGKLPLSLPSGTLCKTLTVCNFSWQLTIPCCSLLPVFLVLNSMLPHTGPKILAYVTYFDDLFQHISLVWPQIEHLPHSLCILSELKCCGPSLGHLEPDIAFPSRPSCWQRKIMRVTDAIGGLPVSLRSYTSESLG